MENRRTATNTRENRELNRGYFSGVCDEICVLNRNFLSSVCDKIYVALERRDIRIRRIIGRLQTDKKNQSVKQGLF